MCQNPLQVTVPKMLRWVLLGPKSKQISVRKKKKTRTSTQHQAISLSRQMKTWRDASNRGPVTVTETVSVSTTAKRARRLWAFHDMTLSRSRLLILSDLSLKSCNRVVKVNNSQGKQREPLKDDFLHIILAPSLDKENMFSFGNMHGASEASLHTHISMFSCL